MFAETMVGNPALDHLHVGGLEVRDERQKHRLAHVWTGCREGPW